MYNVDGTEKRADQVTLDTQGMTKSITYIGEAVDANGNLLAGLYKKSETIYYSRPNSTRGDEVAQTTYTYNESENTTQTTHYYYGGSFLPAQDAGRELDDPLTMSKTFDHHNGALISETYYGTLDANGEWLSIGFKGEELVKEVYRYNYKKDGSTYMASRADYYYRADGDTLEEFLDSLKLIAKDMLRDFLNTLELGGLPHIDTKEELIDYLKTQAVGNGYSETDVTALITNDGRIKYTKTYDVDNGWQNIPNPETTKLLLIQTSK